MALTVIGPILVDGNDDFGEKWKGSGTETDPYKLREDYEIDAAGNDYGIKIVNSEQHVEIKDCKIHGASGTRGAGIHMEYGDNVKIINNEIYENDIGIFNEENAMDYTTTIEGNDITNNGTGIHIFKAKGTVVKRNNISGNTTGIYAYQNTHDCEILENDISSNSGHGIELEEYTAYNLIKGNTIKGNGKKGIYCHHTAGNNDITENTIENNETGIRIDGDCSDNKSWKNEFIGNTVQASDPSDGGNDWDLGDPAGSGEGGNYWSDYQGADRGDGVGDTPYDIADGTCQDGYPLVVKDIGVVWGEKIEAGASIDGADVGEIKGEIDGIAEHVGLDITWEEFGDDDLPAVDGIKSAQAKELRSKTEKIDTNRHSTVYSGNETEVDQGHDVTVEGEYDTIISTSSDSCPLEE